jgi:hypothetical protein
MSDDQATQIIVRQHRLLTLQRLLGKTPSAHPATLNLMIHREISKHVPFEAISLGDIPDYVRSIDAALTLIPEHWVYMIERNGCNLLVPNGGDIDRFEGFYNRMQGEATAKAIVMAVVNARIAGAK